MDDWADEASRLAFEAKVRQLTAWILIPDEIKQARAEERLRFYLGLPHGPEAKAQALSALAAMGMISAIDVRNVLGPPYSPQSQDVPGDAQEREE